jgi:hypothetical protein
MTPQHRCKIKKHLDRKRKAKRSLPRNDSDELAIAEFLFPTSHPVLTVARPQPDGK